jgi:hypothetical protein
MTLSKGTLTVSIGLLTVYSLYGTLTVSMGLLTVSMEPWQSLCGNTDSQHGIPDDIYEPW